MKKNWKFWAGLIFAIMFVLSVCVLAWNWRNGEYEIYNAVSALFSGLAFIAFISSIYLQSQELKLQRQELEDTRKELEGQKEQLRLQNVHFAQQNFETTLFNLLATQRQIIDGMEYEEKITRPSPQYTNQTITEISIYKNRKIFRKFREDLIDLYDYNNNNLKVDKLNRLVKRDILLYLIQKNHLQDEANLQHIINGYATTPIQKVNLDCLKEIIADEKTWIIFLYELLYGNYMEDYDNYFANLLEMFIFVHKNEKLESKSKSTTSKYKSYIDMIRSQMSTSELFVLFYNQIRYPERNHIIKYYDFFKPSDKDFLHEPSHIIFFEKDGNA